jgi:exodeoxyribonuclease VII large subunit
MAEYISVSALNHIAKLTLAACDPLNDLIVCGEISNFVRNTKSGHLYFSLKDENASVKAVMFREKARLLNFEPQSGMTVLAYGNATIYERDGAFQLYAEYLRPFGAGAAQMAFDALKRKLEVEGLFAPEHKRALPMPPKCIGVVTSRTGAALQDVLHVLARRWPMARLLLAPVSVQGFEAEGEIVAAIRRLDADPRTDVLLVTRGGGSKEDLWVFNSERIARAVYGCKKPVVSAVGHEIDYTILDYVADRRAPTPSAAAEILVPDIAAERQKIFIFSKNIQSNMQSRAQIWYNTFENVRSQAILAKLRQEFAKKQQLLSGLAARTTQVAHDTLEVRRNQLQTGAALAASLNPYQVLAHGYVLVKEANGKLTNLDALRTGQKIQLCSDHMCAACTVNEVSREDLQNENAKIV